MKSQLDYLDRIAGGLFRGPNASRELGNGGGFPPLSTGERVYVALAANRADLLASMGYTIAEAVARLGDDWTRELTRRWQYGPPEHAL